MPLTKDLYRQMTAKD